MAGEPPPCDEQERQGGCGSRDGSCTRPRSSWVKMEAAAGAAPPPGNDAKGLPPEDPAIGISLAGS